MTRLVNANTSSMSRLEKKCLVASCCFHGFLVLLLMFGSAFFTARKVEPPLQMLNVIPGRLVDEALSGGGGNPNLPRTEDRIKGDTLNPVAAQAVAPPEPVPPKAPPQKSKPEPLPPEPVQPKTVKPTKAVDESPPKISKQSTKDTVKPKVEEAPKQRIDLSELRPISREDTEQDKRKAREAAEAREAKERAAQQAAAQAAARERQRKAAAAFSDMAQQLGTSMSGLRQGFNNGTKVDVGGPGGAAFANYKQYVQMAYENAWVITPELTDQDFVAQIRVTISRVGRVVASRIIKPSGSSIMDRSVQKAMDRVRADGLPPFPEGATDAERSFTIEFNLKAKRLG